jgi:hypothetical protein
MSVEPAKSQRPKVKMLCRIEEEMCARRAYPEAIRDRGRGTQKW